MFPELKFSHLTDKDGLSNSYASCFAQDTNGIIWIGTYSGLNRFDGYSIKNFYANANDPKSISNNYVSSIVPDRKNNLWVSTTEGLFYFNTKTQSAISFKSIPEDTATFRNSYRPRIYIDSGLLPWITTYDGVYHFRDSVHYYRTEAGLNAFPGLVKKKWNVYGPLTTDRKGKLWSCWDDVICRLDNNTKKILQAYKCPEPIIIRYIFIDSYNRCWVSTWGKGIYLFTPELNGWKPFSPSKNIPIILGTAEWEINGKKILVFSCGNSTLFFIDESDLTTYTYLFDAANVTIVGLPFVDKQNILWVPTSDGVYYASPSNNLFSVVAIAPLKNEQGKNMLATVYNMREEKSGYWISKRNNGGILWYDRNWKLLKSWLSLPIGPRSRYPDLGLTSQEGFDFKQVGNNMYVTTEGGISVLNFQTLKWSAYCPRDAKIPPRLRTIVVENDHKWWVRSFNQGIFIFNPVSREFVKLYSNNDSCKKCLSGNVNYLLQDREQRIFATTERGLFQYHEKGDYFEKLQFSQGPVPSKNLLGMTQDNTGLIWLGAENGIFGFNPDNHRIEKSFSENNKIGVVFRVCTDDDQNIWFTSNSGYWCWLRKPDKIIHFEYSLGLPKTEEGICYKTSDGFVYAGGKDAAVRFYPDRLMNYAVAAKTKIIEAVTNDTLALITTNSSGQKKLTLSPEENSIHINFDVINYDLISNNQFFYKLSPGDKGWKQIENGHMSFYNLQPGSYRLEVKGASKLKGNFTNTDSLDLTVQPYWYQSSWFKFLCMLMAVIIITFIVRYRIQIVRKEASFKQRIMEIEMTALRTQMNPHFIFNSLNSIENFIMQNEKRLASDYLNKFARLIRMILENSRKQAVPIAKDMEAVQLYVDLEQLRFNNKFRYITDIDKILLEG
ncbi:MAG TPA: histidine kinase, partial [Puia sp.]|nr:histidine kinase [Puia sp.]